MARKRTTVIGTLPFDIMETDMRSTIKVIRMVDVKAIVTLDTDALSEDKIIKYHKKMMLRKVSDKLHETYGMDILVKYSWYLEQTDDYKELRLVTTIAIDQDDYDKHLIIEQEVNGD